MVWTVDLHQRHSTPTEGGAGWLWYLSNDELETRRVLVEVTGQAISAIGQSPASVSEPTRRAYATQGRSEIDKILEEPDLPLGIVCSPDGCTWARRDEL